MVQLANKKECTGCGACYNICPTDAIKMKTDKTGFLYPVIDENKCIECNKCTNACPILNIPKIKDVILTNKYIARISNKDDLLKSTSGGIFYAVAEYVIKNDGVVFGVVIDEEFSIYHKSADKLSELEAFRGSKYVQSDTKNTFREAKKTLEENKLVLYSGTPCQIAGLRKFLNKDYDKLICVDIFCRSVASPLLFEKYIEMKSGELGNINKVKFRDKSRGYDYPCMMIEYKKGKKTKVYKRGSESDEWLRLFLSNEGDRPSCKDCIVTRTGYFGDITIGDYNSSKNLPERWKDNSGVSLIIVNTKKGLEIINNLEIISKKEILDFKEKNSPRPASIQGDKFDKDLFYKDAKVLSGKSFFDKYYKETPKVIIIRYIREITHRIGIYSFLKKHKNRKRKN